MSKSSWDLDALVRLEGAATKEPIGIITLSSEDTFAAARHWILQDGVMHHNNWLFVVRVGGVSATLTSVQEGRRKLNTGELLIRENLPAPPPYEAPCAAPSYAETRSSKPSEVEAGTVSSVAMEAIRRRVDERQEAAAALHQQQAMLRQQQAVIQQLSEEIKALQVQCVQGAETWADVSLDDEDMFDSDVEYRVFLQHGDGGDLVQVVPSTVRSDELSFWLPALAGGGFPAPAPACGSLYMKIKSGCEGLIGTANSQIASSPDWVLGMITKRMCGLDRVHSSAGPIFVPAAELGLQYSVRRIIKRNYIGIVNY